MARGWESKSIEAQIDAAEHQHRSAVLNQGPDPAKLNVIRQKESILLSRTHVLREMSTAQNPRYKAVLQKALTDLDAKLSAIHE